jgi:hypothetical protein
MSEQALDYAGFIRLVLDVLEACGVEYLIGGAVAAWAWGEPRATQDLDVVIHVPIESVDLLSQELAKRDMFVPSEMILDALLETRADHPLSAIHLYSGYKADFYLLRKGDALRESAFQRRMQIDLGPDIGPVYLHSPEDLILYKLIYYSIRQQTKHLRDITAIVLTTSESLDNDYIQFWAERKGLLTLWREIDRTIHKSNNPELSG